MKERQQDIEHSDYRSQASLDIRRQAMMDALEIANDVHHRQSRFDTHTFIPGPFGAQLAVGRNPLHTAKAIISQHNATSVGLFDRGMEVLIMGIHRGPIPVHHLPRIIEQPAQFDADTPASFIFAFLAHLLRTTTLSDGKEQLNRITIDHGEETGLSQQLVAPVLMGLEQPLQAGTLGQSRKQVAIVATETAVTGHFHCFAHEHHEPVPEVGLFFTLLGTTLKRSHFGRRINWRLSVYH